MIRSASADRTRWYPAAGLLSLLLVIGGCSRSDSAPVRIENTVLGPLLVAVAPALNFSGSHDFDRNAVADIMASELNAVEGVEVVPVSRVLAALAEDGREEVASPAHAMDLVNRLGVDAILVFAVTEYDPYDPPVVGLAAQLYGVRRDGEARSIDPVRISREARLASSDAIVARFGPIAQAERVFDGSHEALREEVKAFAAKRDADESPFAWRLYLVSQRHFMRFCSYRTIEALFGMGADSALSDVTGQPSE
jgi:hypothetical protein